APYNSWFLILAALEYAMSVAYSAHWMRVKERPILGPLTIGLSQFAIPQLLVFAVFEDFSAETILFSALFFVAGLRSIIFHQILDRVNALSACVVTLLTRFGGEKPCRILALALVPLEIGLLGATLIVIETHLHGMLAYTVGVAAVYWVLNRAGGSIQSLMSI